MQPLIKNPPSVLTVKTLKGEQSINLLEIVYLQAHNKKTWVYFVNDNYVETCHMLKWFEKRLPVPLFYRSHMSFIVNCSYVEYICSDIILFKLKHLQVPLSRQRKRYFKNNLEQFKANLEHFKLHETLHTVPEWSIK